MKRVLFSFVVLFLLLGQSFLFADRATVDSFLRSYEALVVEAEALARRATITSLDMMPLVQRAAEFSERAETIQQDLTWTTQDATRLLDLTARYNTASMTINEKVMGSSPAVPGFTLPF